MKLRACMLWGTLLLLVAPTFLGAAPGPTRITAPGVTVVSASSCPASRVWVAWGAKQVAVVQEMDISVNGRAVGVPLSVYASLFEPEDAALRFDGRNFVLRINGADGGEAYFTLIHFDLEGVNQLSVYDAEFPGHPTQVTHFYRNADRGE